MPATFLNWSSSHPVVGLLQLAAFFLAGKLDDVDVGHCRQHSLQFFPGSTEVRRKLCMTRSHEVNLNEFMQAGHDSPGHVSKEESEEKMFQFIFIQNQ